ncbi:MAG: hypothetical protein IKN89_05100, partial [Oscillospiraceae bacterium]|nr:hypothetical protein [Oscillospiraceae bacterium]
HLACIMFRHIARKSWPIQEVFPAIFRQSDENSDCAIYAPELCGVAFIEFEYNIHNTGGFSYEDRST